MFWLAVRTNQFHLLKFLLTKQKCLELLASIYPNSDIERPHDLLKCINEDGHAHPECELMSKFHRDLLEYIDEFLGIEHSDHGHGEEQYIVNMFRELNMARAENAQARSILKGRPMNPKQQFKILTNVLDRDDYKERTIHYTFGCYVPQSIKQHLDKYQLAEINRYKASALEFNENTPEDQLGYPERCWILLKDEAEPKEFALKDLCCFIVFRRQFIKEWAYKRYTPIGFRNLPQTPLEDGYYDVVEGSA